MMTLQIHGMNLGVIESKPKQSTTCTVQDMCQSISEVGSRKEGMVDNAKITCSKSVSEQTGNTYRDSKTLHISR